MSQRGNEPRGRTSSPSPAAPTGGSDPSYRRLPIAQKRAANLASMREPAVVCPICETATTARDLLDHLAERCPGRREPHPSSAWVTWREALAMGILRSTLSRWVSRGLVRVRGELQDRRYLLRDLVTLTPRRRKFPIGNRRLDPARRK